MSHPEVQNLFYGPTYEAAPDFTYPYKLHSGHSIPSSVLEDSRDFPKPLSRSTTQMSSHHNSLVPDHDAGRYSPPSYSVRGAEPPQHPLYSPSPFMEQHQPQNFMFAPNHHPAWGSVDPLTVPPEAPLNYGPLPGMSFPEAPRLTPPPVPPVAAAQRLTLAGSLDPATGIFYRTPEHPRLRTAQACEKCRTRKAKCSGEHPSCQRCITKGLVCEYAKEGRVRGPNKAKAKTSVSSEASSAPSSTDDQDTKTESTPLSIHSRRSSADRGLYSPKSSSPSSPSRHNPLAGERRMSRPRPPHLRLDIMQNHQETVGSEQKDFAARPYSNDGTIQADGSMLQTLGGTAAAAASYQHISFVPPHQGQFADATPTVRSSQEWVDMRYVAPENFHGPMVNEMYQPVATFPPRADDPAALQYHHATNRRSIGSLSYSTGTTSTVSSPVTPLSATHTMHDLNGAALGDTHPDLHMGRTYPDMDQQQGLATTWQDANQLHLNMAPELNGDTPTLDKTAWAAGNRPVAEGGSSENVDGAYNEQYHEGENVQEPGTDVWDIVELVYISLRYWDWAFRLTLHDMYFKAYDTWVVSF